MWLLLLILIMGLAPLATLIAALLFPRSELAWGRKLLPADGAGPYREEALVRWTRSREPRLVRVTGVLTAFLGGMAIPGGFAGIVGIAIGLQLLMQHPIDADVAIVVGLAASVPSGLVIAIQCFRLFGPMLENRAGSTPRMRALARHSLVHNVLVALVWTAYLPTGSREAAPWAALFAIYVLVSLAHVVLLRRAAALMDRCAEEALHCEQVLKEAGERALESPSALGRRVEGLTTAPPSIVSPS
jgi:hypothetical protein